MKIKDLFDKNKGKVIIEYHNGIKHEFNTYEEYEKYLNDYFGDKIVNSVLNESIESRISEVYSLEFNLRDDKGRIFNYEEFLWEVQ
jgi:hypothetical protein